MCSSGLFSSGLFCRVCHARVCRCLCRDLLHPWKTENTIQVFVLGISLFQ